MKSFKNFRLLFCLIIVLILISGTACTRKNNLTGNNWSGTRPLSFTDSLFTLGYSFADTARVSGLETGLLAGKMSGAEAIAVMRFSGMPADSTIASVTEAKLSLTIKRRSAEPRNPLTLSFFRLKWHWAADSTDVIADSSMVTAGIADYVVPVIPALTDSTVSVNLPNSLIQDWYHQGSTGLSIAIKTDDNGYVELHSIDGGAKGPKLSFKYKLTTDAAGADWKTYDSFAISDSYKVIANPASLLENAWLLQNISPSRIYTKFELNSSKFRAMDGSPLDSLSLKRVTINKAELVFYVKENPYYGNNTNYSLRAYNVLKDSINTATTLNESDYELLTLTGISSAKITADSIVVNITPLVQGYLSGDKENFGIMIKSLQEMQNFGKLELWHFLNAPAGKKPLLRVRYTPPYL